MERKIADNTVTVGTTSLNFLSCSILLAYLSSRSVSVIKVLRRIPSNRYKKTAITAIVIMANLQSNSLEHGRNGCHGITNPRPMDSPRSRGWTQAPISLSPRGAGFPALAGMDPSSKVTEHGLIGIPRARGDGPRSRNIASRSGEDSPRSRGWTVGARRLGGGGGGFPALAGMDPRRRVPRARPSGIPRARGDGPSIPLTTRPRPADSPRSRGWTPALLARLRHAAGFPALAGMDPIVPISKRTIPGIPRARGDGPSTWCPSSCTTVDSPRSRGWDLRRSAAVCPKSSHLFKDLPAHALPPPRGPVRPAGTSPRRRESPRDGAGRDPRSRRASSG